MRERFTSPFLLVAVVTSLLIQVEAETRLQCVSSVKKFSSKASPQHYYTCDGGKEHPELTKCPDDTVYHTRKQKCVGKGENSVGAFDSKALGRNFQLGSLYDARESKFYPDSSPWSQDTLANQSREYNRLEVKTEFTADKTVKSKTVSIGIGAEFRFEILFGLITIHGGASYLRSETKTNTEVHVQMNYYTTKYARTISKKTEIDYRGVCDSPDYTHVVTSVTYGLQAVMDFHKKTQDDDFEGNLAGSLGWILGKIPGLSTGSSHMSEEDRVLADSCTLAVFGDFSPDDKQLPGNLNEAVEFYRRLPELTGSKENHWEGTTIQEFHATPISELCSELNPTLNEISEELMLAVEEVLGDLEDLSMKVGGYLDSDPSIRFPPIQENLQIYQDALAANTRFLKGQLKELTPKIRAGETEAEEDLIKLLIDHADSQFQVDRSMEFLINRGREIQAVSFLLDSFPQASNRLVQDFRTANDAGILFSRDRVVLLELNVLSPTNVSNNFLDGHPMDEDKFWYNNQTVSGEVGSTLRTFLEFAEANVDLVDKGYLIKLNLVSEEAPTVMTAFIKGRALPEQFKVPITTNVINPYDITVNGFKFTLPRANTFVTSCHYAITDTTTLSRSVAEGQFESSELTITVDTALPLHSFTIQYSYNTEVGITPPSLPVQPFFTSPATEPQDLEVSATFQSLSMSWAPPAIVAESLQPQLQYRLQIWQDDTILEEIVTGRLEATFERLASASFYNITVSAFVSNFPLTSTMHRLVEGPSALLSAITLPLPPIIQDPHEVTETTVLLNWLTDFPDDLVNLYSVEYDRMDFNGTAAQPGTTKQIYLTDTEDKRVEIAGLDPSTLYAFRTKMFTSAGDTAFSSNFYVQTDFNQTELDELLNDITEQARAEAGDLLARARFCAWTSWAQGSGVISYSQLLQEEEEGTGSSMDPQAGTFTAGRDGLYKALVSLEVEVQPGDEVNLWVRKGESAIGVSLLHSRAEMDEGRDNTSKEVVLSLAAGEKLSVFMDTRDGGVNDMSFCVASVELK